MQLAVCRKQGFTLAELIVFLALLGVVLAIGYRLLFFGQNTFAMGSDQFQVQSELRTAGDFMINELRNAEEIDIINAADLPASPDHNYRYIYLEGSKIIHQHDGNVRELTGAIVQDQDIFEIRKDSGNRNFLSIRMTGMLNGHSYDLSTEILLKNVVNKDPKAGKAIKYKKP